MRGLEVEHGGQGQHERGYVLCGICAQVAVDEVHGAQPQVPLRSSDGSHHLPQGVVHVEELNLAREVEEHVLALGHEGRHPLLQPVQVLAHVFYAVHHRAVRPQVELPLRLLEGDELLDGDGALVGRIVVGGIQVDDRAWPTGELEKVLDPVAVRRLTTTRRADDQLTKTHPAVNASGGAVGSA